MTDQTQSSNWVDASTLPVTRHVEVATVGVLTMHPKFGPCAVFAIERKGVKSGSLGTPCVIFPTGMVEKGEGTAMAAARESLEELGIQIPDNLPEIRCDTQYRSFDGGLTATKYVIHYFTVVLPWDDVVAARSRMSREWKKLMDRKGVSTPAALQKEDLRPEEQFETCGMAVIPLEGLDLEGTAHVRSAKFATCIAKGYEPNDFAAQDVIFVGAHSLSKAESQRYQFEKIGEGERLLTMPYAHLHHTKIPYFLEYLAAQHAAKSAS
ncbi:MAG: NUDIX hydrolase [Alphaproteobacteria bacterium]|nr:NUDIX hydrolase [Alphaproteobacteria bacterium]